EFLEGVQDRFRIGIRSKPVPFRFKQRPERSMVVDLTVERNPARTVLVRHRLVAASAIDDCKPAMPEHNARVLMEAFTVRPAVRDGVRHRLDGLSCVSSKRAVQPEYSGDTTHLKRPPRTPLGILESSS